MSEYFQKVEMFGKNAEMCSNLRWILRVTIVFYFSRYEDPEVFRQAKTILLEMGHFFQVQDDFLDCFGNPEVTGKIGTDIQDNKCTWLAVLCMQRATEAQKQIMRDCYGKHGKFHGRKTIPYLKN